MRIERDFPLQPYNSFGINAKCSVFVEIEDILDYRLLIDKPKIFTPPYYILGGGNNSLFKSDFEGNIIKISNKGLKVLEDSPEFRIIEVGAGEDWNDLVNYCIQNHLYGIENLIDIPGNVGSAPIQNIGAYGAEVSTVIEKVHFFEVKTGKKGSFTNAECQFSYRNSIFKNDYRQQLIISSVIFRLAKNGQLNTSYGDINQTLNKLDRTPTLKDLAHAVSQIRASKLPDPKKIGNAGSFFKNPIVNQEKLNDLLKEHPNIIYYPINNKEFKLAAGWLIDQAGWKGKQIENAAVHSKQALVLINATGEASGEEIMQLANSIIEDIKRKYDVVLEPEVNIV